jgi:hypothetical protein
MKLKQTQVSRVLLLSSGVIFLTVAFALIELLSMDYLFPPTEKRHDIRDLYVGTLNDLCPGAQSNPGNIEQYEDCIKNSKKLNYQNMTHLSLPSLDEILEKGRPVVEKMLRAADARVAHEIFDLKFPFILGIDIPTHLFSERVHSPDHFKLVHGYMRNAVICLNQECDFNSTLTDQGVLTVPLIRPRSNTLEMQSIPVWIFGSHIDWAHIMSLQNGVFIAKDADLWQAKRFYPLNMNAGMLAFSMMLCSIFIILFFTSFVWKNYSDHVYLLYLGVNFSALAIYDRIMAPQVVVDFPAYTTAGHIFIWSCVASAMLGFCYSTLRTSAKHTFILLMLAKISMMMVGLGCLYYKQFNYDKALQIFDLVFNWVMAIGSTSIAIYSIVQCSMRIKMALQRYGRTSLAITFEKRLRQQIAFAIFIAVFNWPCFTNIYSYYNIGRMEPIASYIAILAYLALFINMIRPSMLRLKRAMDLRDTVSEAGILKLLMAQNQFEIWKSLPRSGYVIEADIRGSTSAMPELKQGLHTVMKVLKQIILHDLSKQDLVINIMKPMGDAWIFIVDPPGGKPTSESFKSFVDHFASSTEKYEKVLRKCAQAILGGRKDIRAQAIGLNIRIFAVNEFYLRQSINKSLYRIIRNLGRDHGFQLDISKEDDSDLDFVGPEAHVMLKYLPKPPPNAVSVGCASNLFHEDWKSNCSMIRSIDTIIPTAQTGSAQTTVAQQDQVPTDSSIDWQKYITFNLLNLPNRPETKEAQKVS